MKLDKSTISYFLIEREARGPGACPALSFFSASNEQIDPNKLQGVELLGGCWLVLGLLARFLGWHG